MALSATDASWRRTQRTGLLALRNALPVALRAQHQASITATLLAHFKPVPGAVVAFYWPFQGEYDPRQVVRQWRQRSMRTVLPVVVEKARPLEFREWWPGVATEPGVFGLPVPQATALLRPDWLLIPPVGFDAQCYRLGYGGGFYDRTLAALGERAVRKIGVAFEVGRMDSIEPRNHDIALDVVVTEAGIHRPQN